MNVIMPDIPPIHLQYFLYIFQALIPDSKMQFMLSINLNRTKVVKYSISFKLDKMLIILHCMNYISLSHQTLS